MYPEKTKKKILKGTVVRVELDYCCSQLMYQPFSHFTAHLLRF